MKSMLNGLTGRTWAALWLALAVLAGGPVWAEDDMPGRTRFPTVKWVELEQLKAMQPNVIIVDARSRYEYDTLHIKGAINVVYGDSSFIDDIKALRAGSNHPIVFYCNGRTCMKSYEATLDAQNAGVSNVFTFDVGIFDWAKAYPDDAELLGKSPVDPARLIGKDKLKAHTLSVEDFEKRIGDSAIILDVRDRYQQEGTTLFPMRQRSVPLDNTALKRYVEQARVEGKTLLIYDATGGQVRWLQYYLESENVASYYFLKGGAKAYYDELMSEMVSRSAKAK